MLANELSAHLARSGSLAGSLEVVELLNELGEAEVEELLAGQVNVVLQSERGSERLLAAASDVEERTLWSIPCHLTSYVYDFLSF